jgi:predicted nucleotidyltransferase
MHGHARRSAGTSLTNVLASGALARVITHFVIHPASYLHFQALRRATALPTRSLQRELARLDSLGLVCREEVGRLVKYRADIRHHRWRVLRSMVREFAAPTEVLRAALAPVPGLTAAFLYGSYGRGTGIHPGSDIDLFVVGDALDSGEGRLELASGLLEAAGVLGREINAVRYTPEGLAARRDRRFVREVLGGEKHWLVGSAATLRRASRGGMTSRKAS